mmetsp:Transcript_1894/g.2003  ORF Transcript_1894/g.2003 Transcript_1894/m.2003 type:complete len:101 (-) Transcript_1894:328-630(-)
MSDLQQKLLEQLSIQHTTSGLSSKSSSITPNIDKNTKNVEKTQHSIIKYDKITQNEIATPMNKDVYTNVTTSKSTTPIDQYAHRIDKTVKKCRHNSTIKV